MPPVVTVCGKPVHGARISGEDAFILSPPGQSLRLRVGSAITGTLAASATLSGSDVVVVLPGGRTVTLENAPVCAPSSTPAPEPTPDLTIDEFDTDPLDPTGLAKVFTWEITYTGDDELTCEFDPGDGAAAFDFVPCELVWSTSFIYDNPGDYTATLTVTDKAGVSATKSIDFEISQYIPAPM